MATAEPSRKRDKSMTTQSIRTLRARRGRACAAVGVALLAALVLAPAAGAQQFTWLSPSTLENTGGTQGADAVACPSAAQCTSVDANGQQVTVNPATGVTARSSAIDLIGRVSRVSCPTTSQCTAVDNLGQEVTFDPTAGTTVNGGLQSVETNLAPDAPSAPLSAVSCATTTFCVAVDNAGNAYRFDPTTPGSSDGGSDVDGTNVLNAVACKSDASLCVAVDSQGNEVSITYPGSTASTKSIDTHPLTGVSCNTGFSSCVVVDAAGQEVTFDPGTGTPAVGTPAVVDGTNPLTAVSCASDYSQCTAVDQLGNETTFAPGGGGSAIPVEQLTLLADVACPAGTDTQCTTVDNRGNEITFHPSNGSSVAGGAHSVAPNAIASMSCPTDTQCTAVEAGERETTFNPTTGSIRNAGPSTIDSLGNRLTAVSCPSATQCTAVDQGSFKTTFDPTTGRPNTAGNVSIETGQSLQAVSCPDTGQCTAVDTRGAEVTFDPARDANGVNQTSPNVIDHLTDNILVAVSCVSDHECVAVDHGGREITFDPTTGNAPGSGNLPAIPTQVDRDAHPSSLSCAIATQCTAVDDAGRALTFDPTTITSSQTNTAGPTSVDGSVPLTSVSCPSTTSCLAVDGGGNIVQFDPTTIDGATIEHVGQAAGLRTVSCHAPFECAVADSEGNGVAGFLPPLSTTPPTITGTAQQGQMLTEHHGTWANSPATSYTYQWQDCDDSGCSPIAGAIGPTYALQASDVGDSIAVQETATNLGGAGLPASSARTSVVLPPAPVRQGPPTIVGTVAQGQTLTEQHGLWLNNPTGYGYQWQVCDSAGHGCTSIAGATGRSYVPQASDIGKALVVQETTSNPGGTSPAAGSAPTAPVAAARAANILAVTSEADHLSSHSAQLHGVLYSQGAPASWQFEYGTTTALGHTTPLRSLAAGTTTAIGVLSSLAHLKPGTRYFVRLDETVRPGTYGTGVQSKGKVLAFTTSLAGRLRMNGSRLTITSRGALASLGCSAPVDCTGELTLTVTRATGGTRHPRARVVRCGRLAVSLRRGLRRQFTVPLSGACRSLLRRPGPQALLAELTGDSTSGQAGFSKEVELSG
jgi:hypothetical protein